MLPPVKIKNYFPSFSQVLNDGIQVIKRMRNDENVTKKTLKDFLGRWSIECESCFAKMFSFVDSCYISQMNFSKCVLTNCKSSIKLPLSHPLICLASESKFEISPPLVLFSHTTLHINFSMLWDKNCVKLFEL